ncbi:hypothetical protein JKG68_25685 [Microvirga aerilata]|jgi:hypothetical protein|uniref:Uncharacterized protein n=1 Tax=Microvirga aerilata TaxID=670292 RepID=A0A936ZGG4_9HYPH|nr:hypothetical protein [Microvirga aerilata]MBL0407320.1 hypothetical protein [Microvirga aerilata]
MAQFPTIKTLANIAIAHVNRGYSIQIEDWSGDTAIHCTWSDQVVDLADMLDDLLSDEHEEQTTG